MENIRFVKFKILNGHPVTIGAEIRFINNPKHTEFKKCHLYTDVQYNLVLDHFEYSEYMTKDVALKILTDLGFIEVKGEFDSLNVNDLKEIKNKIPLEWIDAHNLWVGYTG